MKFRLSPIILALGLGHLPVLTHAALDIPPVPLQTGSAVAPNLFYLLDDSGSMQWEIMPDDYLYTYYVFPPPGEGQGRGYGGAHVYGGQMYPYHVLPFDTTIHEAVYLRSSTINAVYYNPRQDYLPWARHDGTSFPNANPRAAYYNPYEPGRGQLDLTIQHTRSAYWWQTWRSHTFWPVTYYVYKGTGNTKDKTSYIRYQYRQGKMYTWDLSQPSNTEREVSNLPWGRSVAAELQNFANWFTYYRSRILAVRAATSLAFSTLGNNYRVGFGTINLAGWKHPPANNNGFNAAERLDFYTRLFQTPINPSGTPLRSALDEVGKQIETNLDYFRPDPPLSCRQNFTILTTDGYWNGGVNSVGNQDGSDGARITHADGQTTYQYRAVRPFRDDWSDTLADVAMKYWKRDLRSDLKNDVATTSADPAFWQHMTTYALSLGVTGTLNPQTDLPALTSGAKNWPNPHLSSPAKLDDLWHATVNGHGEFVAAQSPQEFAEGLKRALGSIANRVSAASNVAGNSTKIDTGSMVYQARYKSGVWTGELLAYAVTQSGPASTPSWNASSLLPAANHRNIFSMTPDGRKIEFIWNQLHPTQQTQLTSPDVLDYLRGSQRLEQNQGGSFRNREGLLGDIVNSSPVYSKATDTLFVGANDGMLHAFDARTGKERFAYVPLGAYPYLKQLSEPNYGHRYFVDGDIAVSDPEKTGGRAILVATLGRGGKGLFGLDVTTPDRFQKTNVLWDRTGDPSDPDMGFILGQPVIANVDGLGWRIITGNGVNSSREQAVLYIIDPTTGAIDAKINTGVGSPTESNGLSSPGVYDVDGDGDVDVAYAGDQQGNLWKFNLTTRSLALGGQPLFIAQNGAGQRQPISAPPLAIKNTKAGDPHVGKTFVFFGTGRYLTTTDPNDKRVQSWYGLIDEGSTIGGRANLRQRTMSIATLQSGKLVRTVSKAIANDMLGRKGWYVDLVTNNGPEGERMIGSQTFLQALNPVLLASSRIPEGDSCTPGGRGYLNAIDPFTGANLGFVFFDVNNDGKFDTADQRNNEPIASIDLGLGMPTDPVCIGDQCFVSGSTGNLGHIRINLGGATTPRRIGWREIVTN
ncbi:MAG: PilC/PilY family type IV pilus protein [Halothiobacillaceae bacterium]